MDLDFEAIQAQLEQEAQLREKLREELSELEKKTRSMTGALNRIHSTQTKDLPALLDTVRPTLAGVRVHLSNIAEIVPENQFWRWKDLWQKHLQSAVFVAVFLEFLSDGRLLSYPQTTEILGFEKAWEDRIYLQYEDYLHGLINMINELPRLAVNSVTMGNYEAPFQISVFVKDLFAGFSLLNLKNDVLRRRFDTIKYDVKKIEEVVYDVSLRGLKTEVSK